MLGAAAAIAKPFDPDDLVLCAKRCLERSHPLRRQLINLAPLVAPPRHRPFIARRQRFGGSWRHRLRRR